MNAETRVLRHESELVSWEIVLRAPDPRLAGLVSEYQGYVERGSPAPLRQQVPTTFLPLIVNFGSPWDIGDSEDASPTAHASFLAGLGERSSYVRATGPASCVQVNLTPLAAHMFLGLPMHELANRVVTLEDVLPRRTGQLTERLEASPTWEARFALLDSVFSARLAEARQPSDRRRLGVDDARANAGQGTDRLDLRQARPQPPPPRVEVPGADRAHTEDRRADLPLRASRGSPPARRRLRSPSSHSSAATTTRRT